MQNLHAEIEGAQRAVVSCDKEYCSQNTCFEPHFHGRRVHHHCQNRDDGHTRNRYCERMRVEDAAALRLQL